MKTYKIPATLAQGYASMDITLSNKDGSVARPFSVKTILIWVGSIIMGFYVITHSIVSRGTVFQQVLFALLWVLWTLLLVSTDKTKRMHAQMLPSLLDYVRKGSRYVTTRKFSKANDFWGIVGIKDIHDGGLIEFADGTVGYLYRVVGSASILLFDADKDRIVNRVNAFYRKLASETECIFITTKEPQKVYRQLAHLRDTYEQLEVDDPDLRMLMEEQFDVLKNNIGGMYKSIHQYMILKSDNRETLQQAKGMLQSEVENSTYMIKQCVSLTRPDDIESVLGAIYKGV